MKPHLVFNFVIFLAIPTIRCVPLQTIRCPCDESSWMLRASEHMCQNNEIYTCISNGNGELHELCIQDFSIDGNQNGCPYTDKDHKSGTVSVYFSTCSNVQCPQKGHQVYTISTLYKYPICWVIDQQRPYMNSSEDLEAVCLKHNATIDAEIFQIFNDTYMFPEVENVTIAEPLQKQKMSFGHGFLLWMSGVCLMFFPMLTVLVCHKIRRKYDPCHRQERKERKARKKQRKEERKRLKELQSVKLINENGKA